MKLISTMFAGVCLIAAMPTVAQTKKLHSTPVVRSTSGNMVASKVITEEDFLKKYPAVKHLAWEPGNVVTLEKNDGTKEKYRLDVRADEKTFIAAYGQILRRSKASPASDH